MNFAVLIFWVIIASSLTARPSTLMVLLLASMPFASLALVPTEITGGLSILPQSMFAVVLILKVIVPQTMPLSPKLAEALQPRHLGCLALFLLVGTVLTAVMPRLFWGDVVIVPMRNLFGAELLSPTPANFTQFGYVTLSVLTTFAVMLTSDEPGFSDKLLVGVLVGGIVCILTGLIDFVATSAGMGILLDQFRNADYAYITDADIGGVRRLVGFTPEASTYGNICVQFAAAIALLRNLYSDGRQRTLATMVTIVLALLAVLSTSSTAYAGLAVLGLVYAANIVRRMVSPSPLGQRGLLWELLAGLTGLVVLLFVLLVRANLFDPLLSLINEQIFNKSLSSSFQERSFWNTTAWNTVASTWGLGIGFGSTRTSNWFAAIVSNSGLIGSALMAIFLIQTFLRRPAWRTALSTELLLALKLSMLPVFLMAGVVSAGPDFGPWVAVVLGAITGIATVRPGRNFVGGIAQNRPIQRRAAGRRAIGGEVANQAGLSASLREGGPDKPTPRPSF